MLREQRRIVIWVAVLVAALVCWAAIEKMWAPLLLLVWLVPWTVPSVRRRIAASRVLDILWHGGFSGILFGVWWWKISSDTAQQATVKGVAFGVVVTLAYAAMWERVERRAREREAGEPPREAGG